MNKIIPAFLLLSLLPLEARGSGSGVVTLTSKYLRFSARSPHKIPMRGRAGELAKQIDQWKVKTRPKLAQIKRRLDRALKAHRSLLLPHCAMPCKTLYKELDLRIGQDLMRLDWTSHYRVRLVLKPAVNETQKKKLSDEIGALVRLEHVVANVKALPRSKEGDSTLHHTVAAALVRRFDATQFAAIRRRLGAKRSSLLLNYAFLQAVGQNKAALVSGLIKMGANRDFQNRARYHDTAVHVAAEAGHAKLIDLLAKAGAKVDLTNEFQATPLLNAIRGGHLEAARVLIKRGADVNHIKQKYWTPLHAAAAQGSVPMVRLLLKNKARCMKVGTQKSPRDFAKNKTILRLLKRVPLVKVKP